MTTQIQKLCDEFTEQLTAHVEELAGNMARAAISAAFGPIDPLPMNISLERARRIGREAHAQVTKRRAAPAQLCPVPGCKNRAAPIFGMVCGDHRDIPKAKIATYRQARRAAKEGA